MRKFPAPCRQKLPSGDRLFINLPRPEGGYQREYLGLWDDPTAQEEYRRRRELFLLTGEWTPKSKDKGRFSKPILVRSSLFSAGPASPFLRHI